jgi:hypothetical protein
MARDIEDTGEIVFEDGPSLEERTVEAAPERLGLASGIGRFPNVLRHMGRMFRLHREEIVSRSGERTHVRLTYRRIRD